MKIRRSILLLIIISVAFMVLLLWYGKTKPAEKQTVTNNESNATAPGILRNGSGGSSTTTNSPISKTPQGALPLISPPASKGERIIELLSTYNDVPIDFYGRVIDQFGNAVACSITFSIGVRNGHQSTVNRGEVATDSNGSFSITGYRGEDLGVVPHKDGYVLATTSTSFIYSHLQDHPYVADQNNPTVIKMWKLQGAEPLAKINL